MKIDETKLNQIIQKEKDIEKFNMLKNAVDSEKILSGITFNFFGDTRETIKVPKDMEEEIIEKIIKPKIAALAERILHNED